MPDTEALIREASRLRSEYGKGDRSPETVRRLQEMREELGGEMDRLTELADAGKAEWQQLSLLQQVTTEVGMLRELGLARLAPPKPPTGAVPAPRTRLSVPDLPPDASDAARKQGTRLAQLYDAFEHFPDKPDGPKEDPDVLAWGGELSNLMVDIAVTETWFLFELGGGVDAIDQAAVAELIDEAVEKIEPELRKAVRADVNQRDISSRIGETLALLSAKAKKKDIFSHDSLGDGPQGVLRMALAQMQSNLTDENIAESAARSKVHDHLTEAMDGFSGMIGGVMQRGRDRLGDTPLIEHTVPTVDLRNTVQAKIGAQALDMFEGRHTWIEAATPEGANGYLFPARQGLAPLPQEGLLNEDQSAVPGHRRSSAGKLIAAGAVAIVIIVIAGVAVVFATRSDDSGSTGTGGSGNQASDAGTPAALTDTAAAILGQLGAPADATSVAFVSDPEGGLSWSITDQAGVIKPSSQIAGTFAVLVAWSPEMLTALFNQSSFPCGLETAEVRVTCPLGAGVLDEEEYIVVGVELEGPVGEGGQQFTYGLAFDDDGDETDNYRARPPFDADFFDNTEYWYRLEIDQAGNRRMSADGFREGAPGYPRYSAAAAIEFDDTLVWVIPRSEVPGNDLAYRATAFHNDGDLRTTPDPGTSGGDVSGSGVTEPLLPVAGAATPFDVMEGVPAGGPAPIPRVTVTEAPDAHITRVLVEEFGDRTTSALAGGTEAVVSLVHPELLAGRTGAACREEMESSVALASAVTFDSVPEGPDLSGVMVVYSPTATIVYETGAVGWAPLLAPGPGGRLYLVLPSCLP